MRNKIRLLIGCIILVHLLGLNDLFAQSCGPEYVHEIAVYVKHMPVNYRNNGIIMMDKESTIWGNLGQRPNQFLLPLSDNDTMCHDFMRKVDRIRDPITALWDTVLAFYGGGWDGDPANDAIFGYGKYRFTIGYDSTYESGDSDITFVYPVSSIIVDFTDSLYGHGFYEPDYIFEYDWDNRNPNQYPWSVTSPVKKTININQPINIWDTTWNGHATPIQRVTRSFTPEAPKNFSLTGGGSIQLSWLSNAESFAIKYMIYRGGNNNFTIIDSISNSGYLGQNHTFMWTDPELGCAGPSGQSKIIHYFIRAKNVSGTPYILSAPTDTLSTSFSCYMRKETNDYINNYSFALYPNYPNPFNPSTEISYQLPAEGKVSLIIYNTLGQEVKTLVNQSKSAGSYKVIWDGKNNSGHAVPSGIYMYRLQTGSFTKTMKMLLVK